MSTTSDAQSLPNAVNPPVRADEGVPNPLAAPPLPEVADASFTWLRWYRSHRNESRESWLANGLTRTRADLHSRDTARRWSAIARLWSAADEHEAAQNSLNELLAGHTLSREGRAYITRWANEHGVAQH